MKIDFFFEFYFKSFVFKSIFKEISIFHNYFKIIIDQLWL